MTHGELAGALRLGSNMKTFFLASLFAATALIIPAPISAAQVEKPEDLVSKVVNCKAERNEQARLKCYDEAVGRLSSAAEQGQIVVMDREDVRRTRRSLFGFSLPKLPFFRGDNSQEEDEPDFVEARMKSARPTGFNKWLVELEDGATWQTTEPDTRGSAPKAGGTVKIRKAAMGSYIITFERSRPLRAMRIR
jgi:hypothetical protein